MLDQSGPACQSLAMVRVKERPTSSRSVAGPSRPNGSTGRKLSPAPTPGPTGVELKSMERTSRIIRSWRKGEAPLGPTMKRQTLARRTNRSVGTVRNWERVTAPHEPRVTEVRAMERIRPGIVRLLFPEAF